MKGSSHPSSERDLQPLEWQLLAKTSQIESRLTDWRSPVTALTVVRVLDLVSDGKSMDWPLTGKAAAMFAVTNIDDMVFLVVFFGQAARSRRAAARVVVGQYLGFAAILAVAVLGALGAHLLPESAMPYLGLLPLLLGVRAAWKLWRDPSVAPEESGGIGQASCAGVIQVATVTFANGGDNISVYVPVFALAGGDGMVAYAAVFLIGVALWCLAGWFIASRRTAARLLERWGDIIVPAVLIGIGLIILIEGGAFGL